jgi:hypothetical protein
MPCSGGTSNVAFLTVLTCSVTEPCHFHSVLVQVLVLILISCFPSFGSGSGSNPVPALFPHIILRKILKLKFLLLGFLLKLYESRFILTWNCLFCFSILIPSKTTVMY